MCRRRSVLALRSHPLRSSVAAGGQAGRRAEANILIFNSCKIAQLPTVTVTDKQLNVFKHLFFLLLLVYNYRDNQFTEWFLFEK